MKKLDPWNHEFRLMLLNEWKSKTNIYEATKNIRSKLDDDSITSREVQKWFKRFDKGKTSLFAKYSHLHVSIRDNPNEQLSSFLFLLNENSYKFEILKCDQRFIEYSYGFGFDQSFIGRYDLFLGEKREIELSSGVREFVMLGDGFLLIFGFDKMMFLYKIDYESLTLDLLDSIQLNKHVRFTLVDQLNPLKFMILIKKDNFSMGKIHKDGIVLTQFKAYDNFGSYYSKRLAASKLQWFNHHTELKCFKFCETDLETMEITKIDVPFNLENDGLLFVKYFEPHIYCWSKNHFYGMFRMSDKQSHLLVFNLDTFKWLDIQILVNTPKELFVDSNDVLTLRVGNYRHEISAFYRIALRKPEKLENLAHLTALRQSTLYGNDKYLECVKKFFITD